MISPGDEIHYVALLDANANTLQILPMREPITVPIDAAKDWITADVNLRVSLRQEAIA